MTLRTVQIIASLEAEAAGPSYSVRRLAENLAGQGVQADIWSVGTPQVQQVGERRFAQDGAGLPVYRQIRASAALHRALDEIAAERPVLHAHGLWLMPNVYPGLVARRHGLPLIHAPRGMLAPTALQFSSAKKRLFWHLWQGRALAAVRCFHATADQEAEDIRSSGLHHPVALIPNGIDLPDLADRPAPGPRRKLLSLGRLHPIKGLDRLLEAWARLEAGFPDWDLDIVGPAEPGYRETLQSTAARLRVQRVTFRDGLYGPEKNQAYRTADLFVLPSLAENFAMVVAEALANGTPAVVTRGAPWAGLAENGCGWWIDHGAGPLADTLTQAMSLEPGQLRQMGNRGRAWMMRSFSWERIARDMQQVYRWCRDGGTVPECVQLP